MDFSSNKDGAALYEATSALFIAQVSHLHIVHGLLLLIHVIIEGQVPGSMILHKSGTVLSYPQEMF